MFTLFVFFLSLLSLSKCAALPQNTTTRTLLSLTRNSTQLPGIISLPVAKLENATTLDHLSGLSKRQIVDDLANTRSGTLYVISLMIGSPAQEVYVQLDTGSSDLWVNPQCDNAGSAASIALCKSYPVYNPYQSSTAFLTGWDVNLAYGKGSCWGHYLVDTINIGGAIIKQQEFGWVQKSDSLAQGILGLSYGVGLGTAYYNVIDQMYVQGLTASRAFSLSLGSVDTPQGSIIFGGIDTKKYYGTLEKRPIIPYYNAPDGFPRYWIYMTSVGITVPGATTSKVYTAPSYKQAVFLDSGGTLSRLPTSIVETIVADFPGAVYYGNGLYTVPCSASTSSGSVDFGFGNTVIKVPYHQFIWVAGPDVCVLGVVATSGVDWVLGDTFLRSAFVVYDQDNNNLLLANAASCGSNLVPIGSGPNAVPSVTGACSGPTPSASSPKSKSTSKASATKVMAITTTGKPTTTAKLTKTSTTKLSSTAKPTTTPSKNLQVDIKAMKISSTSQATLTSSSQRTSTTPSKKISTTTTSSSKKSTLTSSTKRPSTTTTTSNRTTTSITKTSPTSSTQSTSTSTSTSSSSSSTSTQTTSSSTTTTTSSTSNSAASVRRRRLVAY